jgi:hypothetical protein
LPQAQSVAVVGGAGGGSLLVVARVQVLGGDRARRALLPELLTQRADLGDRAPDKLDLEVRRLAVVFG